MMKLAPALNLSLGALLVVPAMTGDGEGGLLQAIEAGNLALEQLGGIQHGLEQGDVGALAELLRLTEPPLAKGPQQDDILTDLRAQVSQLQLRADKGEAARATGEEQPELDTWVGGEVRLQRGPGGLRIGEGPVVMTPRAGTDGSVLSELTAQSPRAGEVTPAPRPKRSFEQSQDFIADALGLGRLLCKAGDHAGALEALKELSAPEAHYWSAVCLERLGREEEAMARYELVVSMEGAGPFAASAANDLAFLKWKREFQERRGARVER